MALVRPFVGRRDRPTAGRADERIAELKKVNGIAWRPTRSHATSALAGRGSRGFCDASTPRRRSFHCEIDVVVEWPICESGRGACRHFDTHLLFRFPRQARLTKVKSTAANVFRYYGVSILSAVELVLQTHTMSYLFGVASAESADPWRFTVPGHSRSRSTAESSGAPRRSSRAAAGRRRTQTNADDSAPPLASCRSDLRFRAPL
jgi:hypothetical protein